MTRREFLTLAALQSGRAGSLSFERIDTHTHVHRNAPAFVESLERGGWRVLSICDSRETGDQPSGLGEMIKGTAAAHAQGRGRIAWATTFDARGFEQRDFAERVIAGLQRDFARGAIAVKIWKNVGMAIRAKSGEYLLPDNAALLPIFGAIQKAGKPLIAHLAEPNACWMPPPAGAPARVLEWNMVGRKGAPSKDEILAARDRLLARYPRLRVIGCHLGSNEEDLDRLAQRLDALPNLAVDVASRVRYLAAAEREKARHFLLKYQDRVLYGTDFTLGAGDEARSAQTLQATHDREWSYFVTDEVFQQRDREGRGVRLPESALRKIFRDNAARWLPGVLG